ncbi:hypothetical protein [Planotetraspora sp. GP83]|uniref:hypothetical protein n=1 Tax=Planotetraspora sp. GP83 TaxID=3156264 RepID=UPI003516B254
MTIDVRVTGAHQLYELNRRLKEAGERKLVTELRKGIRTGTKPAVAAAKRAVLTIPVTNSRRGGRSARQAHAYARSKVKDEERRREKARRGAGLRRTIAGAIRTQIRTGPKTAAVRIDVDLRKLPPDQRSLPAHLDSADGWYHTRPSTTTRGRTSAPVVIGLPCSGTGEPNPLTEARAWRTHVEIHRQVRTEPAVPGATGLRVAGLPYQVWQTGSLVVVVVNAALPHHYARVALRAALAAIRPPDGIGRSTG